MPLAEQPPTARSRRPLAITFPALRADELPLAHRRPRARAADADPDLGPGVALRATAAGEDGLVLSCGSRQAVFLPVMWEQLKTPREFVARLLDKAGSGATRAWSTSSAAFSVEMLEEKG